jgi:hypothetical protein
MDPDFAQNPVQRSTARGRMLDMHGVIWGQNPIKHRK